jgi:hypothetical protein
MRRRDVRCATESAARAGGGHRKWTSMEREISFYSWSLSLGELGWKEISFYPYSLSLGEIG